jgi:hypothetical protein
MLTATPACPRCGSVAAAARWTVCCERRPGRSAGSAARLPGSASRSPRCSISRSLSGRTGGVLLGLVLLAGAQVGAWFIAGGGRGRAPRQQPFAPRIRRWGADRLLLLAVATERVGEVPGTLWGSVSTRSIKDKARPPPPCSASPSLLRRSRDASGCSRRPRSPHWHRPSATPASAAAWRRTVTGGAADERAVTQQAAADTTQPALDARTQATVSRPGIAIARRGRDVGLRGAGPRRRARAVTVEDALHRPLGVGHRRPRDGSDRVRGTKPIHDVFDLLGSAVVAKTAAAPLA